MSSETKYELTLAVLVEAASVISMRESAPVSAKFKPHDLRNSGNSRTLERERVCFSFASGDKASRILVLYGNREFPFLAISMMPFDIQKLLLLIGVAILLCAVYVVLRFSGFVAVCNFHIVSQDAQLLILGR